MMFEFETLMLLEQHCRTLINLLAGADLVGWILMLLNLNDGIAKDLLRGADLVECILFWLVKMDCCQYLEL